MKAFLATQYGGPDVLHLRDVETPVPGDEDVRIRVHATTVTAGDWRVRSLSVPSGFKLITRLFFGLRRPRRPILGTELAGVVEATGRDVARFRVGDPVFAYCDTRMGSHAEYVVLPERGAIAPKPAHLRFGEAAALSFGGTTALHFWRRGGLQAGHRVLVNGASGAVGTAAVQLARHFGAHVTGVCSTANVDLVRSLGADEVIDYTREDVAARGGTYDLVMDTAGTLPYGRSKSLLAPDGRLLLVLSGLPDLLQAPWVGLTSRRRVVAGPASGSAEALRFLAGLAEQGRFAPVIDRTYPFEEMVEAHRYVDTGRKKGNVVVALVPEAAPQA